MLHRITLMGLTMMIDGGMAGASEDTGKSTDELFDLMKDVHAKMNETGRNALIEAGYEFTDEGDVWSGVGAGLLSLLYLLHAKSTVRHIAEVNGMLDDDEDEGVPEPIN